MIDMLIGAGISAAIFLYIIVLNGKRVKFISTTPYGKYKLTREEEDILSALVAHLRKANGITSNWDEYKCELRFKSGNMQIAICLAFNKFRTPVYSMDGNVVDISHRLSDAIYSEYKKICTEKLYEAI